MCPVKVVLLAILSGLSLLGLFFFTNKDHASDKGDSLKGVRSHVLMRDLLSNVQIGTTAYIFLFASIAMVHMYLFGMMDDIHHNIYLWGRYVMLGCS